MNLNVHLRRGEIQHSSEDTTVEIENAIGFAEEKLGGDGRDGRGAGVDEDPVA